MNPPNDPALNAKVKKSKLHQIICFVVSRYQVFTFILTATEKISENVHIVANEPSLAFYRIQENVRKVVPVMIEKRGDVMKLKEDLQGVCYDLEYSVEAVKSIDAAEEPLKNIQELLKNAIFLKQQLKYEETRRKKDSNVKDSVYKRFSAHIPLEISGVMRETTSRVENIMGINSATVVQAAEGIQRSHTTLH